MRRLIIFLICKRLGLRKYDDFRFSNQKSGAIYFFTDTELIKVEHGETCKSTVSLNWLLDDNCKVVTPMVYGRNRYECD